MKTILFLLIYILFCQNTQGQEKKPIQVKFKISYETYRKSYPASINKIEDISGQKITNKLNNLFHFFHFQESQCRNKIVIELGSKTGNNATGQDSQETGFKINVYNDSILINSSPLYFTFRTPIENMNPLSGNISVFISDIAERFDGAISPKHSLIIKNLLSKISVTNDFYMICNMKSFIIPVSYKEHKIDKRSKFLIVTEAPHPFFEHYSSSDTAIVVEFIYDLNKAINFYKVPESSSMRETFSDGCLFVKFISGDQKFLDSCQTINSNSSVTKMVFLTEYVPYTNTDIMDITPDAFSEIINPESDENN